VLIPAVFGNAAATLEKRDLTVKAESGLLLGQENDWQKDGTRQSVRE